jgi:hypothetical protein
LSVWLRSAKLRRHSLNAVGEDSILFRFSFHSNCRNVLLAAIVALPILAGGCAMWDGDRWNLDRYRDERAVDIEQRLERTEPVVKNPF